MSTVTRLHRLLSILDVLIALFLTFPLTCMYWRGIWDLIGHYVLPGRVPLTLWVQTSVGLLQMVGLWLLPFLDARLEPSNKVKYWIITRIFMYVHTLTYMFYWHGLWDLVNYYLGTDWRYSMASLVTSWMALVLLGGCRSTMWPPFFISIDTLPGVLRAGNRFGSEPSKGRWLNYVSDAFTSQMLILGIAVIAWRSAFNIFDGLITPDDRLKSDVITAVAGFVACTFFMCIQIPLGMVSIRLDKEENQLWKLLWEDNVYFVVFLALSMLWRGCWNLNARYVISELPLGGWVNHVAGTVGLMAMQTFTEVSAFGMIRDGQDKNGDAFFPVRYLRVFFQDRLLRISTVTGNETKLGNQPDTKSPSVNDSGRWTDSFGIENSAFETVFSSQVSTPGPDTTRY